MTPDPIEQTTTPLPSPISATAKQAGGWVWQLATLIFALLAALFAWLWRRSTTGLSLAVKPVEKDDKQSEKQAFKALTQACQGGKAAIIRKALLTWAQHYWQNTNLTRISDISSRLQDQASRDFCHALEAALYGETTGNNPQILATQALLDHLKALRSGHHKARRSPSDLPPLYASA